MKEKGWLEKALPGRTIKWIKFDSGATINTAFVSGSVDLAAIGSSPVARGLSEPLNIPYQVTWVLDVAGDNEALVARDGSGIKDVRDLVGHKVATPFSSTSHYSLLAALDKAGVAPSKVKLLDLEPQDIAAAWSRGDIDAAYVWLPTLDELGKTGRTLVSSRQLAAAGKPTLDLGVASTSFIKAQPEVIAAWRKVEARALNLIHDDPSAAAGSVGKELGISSHDAAAQLKQGIFLKPAEQADSTWLVGPGTWADWRGTCAARRTSWSGRSRSRPRRNSPSWRRPCTWKGSAMPSPSESPAAGAGEPPRRPPRRTRTARPTWVLRPSRPPWPCVRCGTGTAAERTPSRRSAR